MQHLVTYLSHWGYAISLRFGSRTAAAIWAARLRGRGVTYVDVAPCADWIWPGEEVRNAR